MAGEIREAHFPGLRNALDCLPGDHDVSYRYLWSLHRALGELLEKARPPTEGWGEAVAPK